MTIARTIGLIGRVLVVAGMLLLFYTAYLLWGTSVYTRKVQSDLAHRVASAPTVSREQVATGAIPPAKPAKPVAPGEPLFSMVVPKIGLRTVVVQGGSSEGEWREALKSGPGHFPDSPYPGEKGNV